MSFCQDMFLERISNYVAKPTILSIILHGFKWFNSVDSKVIFFFLISDKKIDFIGQLFDANTNIKS